MKTAVMVIFLAVTQTALGFAGTAGDYQCKVDSRGVVVCYPKPRGF